MHWHSTLALALHTSLGHDLATPRPTSIYIRYDPATGLWLLPGKGTYQNGSLTAAPAAAPPVSMRPRGKPPVLGGLGASGLKYNPATGMWLSKEKGGAGAPLALALAVAPNA